MNDDSDKLNSEPKSGVAKFDDTITINDAVYSKVKHLGNGSYSSVSVYRKHSTNSQNKLVALKRLNVKLLTSHKMDVAMNEVKILSILSHENIIKYYGCFPWKQRFFIEMEYADAGTLAEFLFNLQKPLEEIEILALFVQIVSGVQYLHEQNIIHRDIKTTNIFLNKQGFIKIGDFGISKLLDSKTDASTFVGTPLYISPEIYEGKPYNKPCDIWSLGCIVYEMASLRKTFQANNLTILMQKIIKGKYLPINSKYSKKFQKIVNSLLNRNPAKRPDAKQLLSSLICLLNRMANLEATIWNCSTIKEMKVGESIREYIKHKRNSKFVQCSYVYSIDLLSPSLTLTPVLFPQRVHLKQICKGRSHFLALTHDNSVYSWGHGPCGELGHGQQVATLTNPTKIESLQGYLVSKVACGNGFSLFLTRNGLVLTCGSAKSYCLGNDDRENCYQARIVNFSLKQNIVDIGCSANHVVVVSAEGQAYSWGINSNGKLGVGCESSITLLKPTQVSMSIEVHFKQVFCGPDCTAFVDISGSVWLCGNNRHNKLALDHHSFFWPKYIPSSSIPLRTSFRNSSVLHVSLGANHSVFVLDDYRVIATGNNDFAQLGLQHVDSVHKPSYISMLKPFHIKTIQTGSSFTVALTNDSLYFWGTRKCRHEEARSVESRIDESSGFIIGKCNQSLMEIIQTFGPDYPIIKVTEPKIVISKMKDLLVLSLPHSVILSIQSILNLYSTKTLQIGAITFNNIFSFDNDSICVVIDAFESNSSTVIGENGGKPPIEPMDSLELKSGTTSTTKYSYAWVEK